MTEPTNPPLIDAYTRAEALADEALIDVSEAAREAGFHVPVAVTAAIFHDCIEWTPADSDRKRGARDEVLGAGISSTAPCRPSAATRTATLAPWTLSITASRVRERPQSRARVDLRLTIHGGDDGRPVVTIMAPEED